MNARPALLALVLAPLAGCGAAPAAEPVAARLANAPRAESDQRPSFTLERPGADGVERLGTGRGGLTLADGRAVVVDDAGALLLVDLAEGAARTRLLDDVVAAPIVLPDGRLLASRSTEPGESDLWLVALDGRVPRALAAARGADSSPFLLDDDRVLFVSTRTGVASLFIVALDGAGLRQLTNVGLVPGRLDEGFVPTPLHAGTMRQRGARVVYDAGDAIWSVDLDTGAGTSEAR